MKDLALDDLVKRKTGFEAGVESCQSVIDDLRQRKDTAYEERNRLVAALARMFPSGVARTQIPGWSEDWHGCVYIDLPTGQVSWHYHDSHSHMFDNLPPYDGEWDGHTTEEKYKRLEALFTVPDESDDCGCDACNPLTHMLGPVSGMIAYTSAGSAFATPVTSTVESREAVLSLSDGIMIGQYWRHHSGRVYEVTGFANLYTSDPEKHPVHVIYRGRDNGRVWTRPLVVFLQKFTLFEEAK